MTDNKQKLTLRTRRIMKGMTQHEAAERLGVLQSTYSIYEKVLDDEKTLDAIGRLLGVSVGVNIEERT